MREIVRAPDKSAYFYARKLGAGKRKGKGNRVGACAAARQVRQTVRHSLLLPFEANEASVLVRVLVLRMRSYADRIPHEERGNWQ